MPWVYASDLTQVKLSKREREEIESYLRQKRARMSGPYRIGPGPCEFPRTPFPGNSVNKSKREGPKR